MQVRVCCATHQQHDKEIQHIIESGNSEQPEFELKIHASQLYRQIITYKQLSDFLMSDPCVENHTAHCNDATTLIESLKLLETAAMQGDPVTDHSSTFWKIVRGMFNRLRKTEPMVGVYPCPGLPKARRTSTTNPSPGGSGHTEVKGTFFLDEFIFTQCDKSTRFRYMAAIMVLLCRTRIMALIGGE
ncbi:hypothetical protein CC80DRAFT_550526 [Byssothecium circinans]|uniref:Uncharacterized protein n=1 Tax=Byssothecium circinans TaxID=147558 RepID=A0A6A5TQX9_9PLEO|nr:hypothetical protein CC80DRAFT_550526 [Byssothecium circinans]